MEFIEPYKVRISIKKIPVRADSPINAMAMAVSRLPAKTHDLISGMSAKKEKAPKLKKGAIAPVNQTNTSMKNYAVTINVRNIMVEAYNAFGASKTAVYSFPESLRQLITSVSIVNYGLRVSEAALPLGLDLMTPDVADQYEEWDEETVRKTIQRREKEKEDERKEAEEKYKREKFTRYPSDVIREVLKWFDENKKAREDWTPAQDSYMDKLKKEIEKEGGPDVVRAKGFWGELMVSMAKKPPIIMPIGGDILIVGALQNAVLRSGSVWIPYLQRWISLIGKEPFKISF